MQKKTLKIKKNLKRENTSICDKLEVWFFAALSIARLMWWRSNHTFSYIFANSDCMKPQQQRCVKVSCIDTIPLGPGDIFYTSPSALSALAGFNKSTLIQRFVLQYAIRTVQK